MIIFKTGLSKKEQSQISTLLLDLVDEYSDFYITKDNMRLFIKENLNVLFDCLKKGDKIAFDETGLAVISGYSDKNPRKYLKILTNDLNNVGKFIKIIFWNVKCDLYMKIKKNNPIKNVLLKTGFHFAGGRGKEVLLVRKGDSNASTNKR